MGGAGLSDREQRLLSEIEAALRKDGAVDRSLRTLRLSTRRHLWEEIRRPHAVLVAALAAASLCLLVAGSLTSVAALIWVSAGMWLATLLMGFGLLRKWTGRPRE
ncbi:DUF3040 domain-containing protein [Actinacidiphila oryziradicis]|uniref:DUF3040 domain-containing protein n=1 Tax=Actinacidiphila oryziradicis TaxID=2571141 RepID=A0A4U0RLY3_9ACTN|nr:DUF3040 domain-containing protein [Actinacidiphila oryziradicis]TJZ96307.1 DUF3040 domain-containing protein [Actinacidiphila oryziradicis]